MRLAALVLMMPLVIIATGLMWFASLWAAHQEDHRVQAEESRRP
jgi:hypothetical protein